VSPRYIPTIAIVITETQIARFWAKVEKTASCWLWRAHVDQFGYGQVVLNGRHLKPHRVAYELVIGLIPDGLQLDHLCRVRHCVRPTHLQPVTAKENIRRGANGPKPECRKGHSLTADNSYIQRDGRKRCRICMARNSKKYHGRLTD